jgi:hypothetical protein
MSGLEYQQEMIDGVEVSEVWGLIDAATGDKKRTVVEEWTLRHADRARANGLKHGRVTVDPNDPGHLLHEAWPTKPDDEGPPRWWSAEDD